MPRIRYAEPIPQQPVTYSGLNTVAPSLNTNIPTLDTLHGGTSGLNTLSGGVSGGQTLSGGGRVDNSSLIEMQRRAEAQRQAEMQRQAEAQRQAEIRAAQEKAWKDANKVRYESTKSKRNEIMDARVPGTSPLWYGSTFAGPSNPNVWGGLPGGALPGKNIRIRKEWDNSRDIPKSWNAKQPISYNWRDNLDIMRWRDEMTVPTEEEPEKPTQNYYGGGYGGYGGYSYPSYTPSEYKSYNPYSWYFSLLNWRI